MDLSLVFFIAGIIILIGFFGGISFEKTKISDVLVLLCYQPVLSRAGIIN